MFTNDNNQQFIPRHLIPKRVRILSLEVEYEQSILGYLRFYLRARKRTSIKMLQKCRDM